MVKRLPVFGVFLLVLSYLSAAQNASFSGKLSFDTAYLNFDEQSAAEYGIPGRSLYSAGTAQLLMTVDGGSLLRAYFGGTFSASSLTDTSSGAALTTEKTFTPDKAYVKIRLPWFSGKTARLNIGKMPVSWGYGTIFNAGDIIFGAEPASLQRTGVSFSMDGSESSLNDLRVSTDWITDVSFPVIDGFLSAEPVTVIPLESDTAAALSDSGKLCAALSDSAGTVRSRFGGRLLFTPYTARLETFEIGCLTDLAASEQQFYIAFDGNLYADYNLCATVSLFKNNFQFTSVTGADRIYTAAERTEQSTAVSMGLSKIYTITNYETARDHRLSLRAETLLYPCTGNLDVFAFADFSCTEKISAAAIYLFTRAARNSLAGEAAAGQTGSTDASDETAHTAAFSLTVKPVSAFELSFTAVVPDLRTVYESQEVFVSCTYRF
jgi:hypothetical protein